MPSFGSRSPRLSPQARRQRVSARVPVFCPHSTPTTGGYARKAFGDSGGRSTTGAGPTGDIVAQTRDALHRIEIALQQAGAALTDVVPTRIYATDISRWREVAAVHARTFGEIRPAATMVEISALIAPEFLVEIEADAYIGSAPESGDATGGNVPSGAGG